MSVLPSQLVCPITNAIFTDPVIDREGNTYERTAIMEWLRQHSTSPITRNALAAEHLAPNRAIADAAAAYRASGTVPTAPPASDLELHEAEAQTTTDTVDILSVSAVTTNDGKALVTITPPNLPGNNNRQPVDVVCVIDISGSMATDASVQNDAGQKESHGLTILDVVKHAAKTVGSMLGPNDRLAIVSFSNNARVEMPLGSMDANGQSRLAAKLEAMQTEGCTNLWDGQLTAMEILKNRTDCSRIGTVMLLTDGCPNCDPPRGHIPTLKKYYDDFGGTAPFTVNTFGFGYSLDSELLANIATESSGMYVFIPDSGLVGTVFVNVVSNVLATCCTDLTVSVESSDPVGSAHSLLVSTSYGAHGRVGTIQYGQTRDFALSLTPAVKKTAEATPAELFVKVTYNYCGKELSTTCASTPLAGPSTTADAHLLKNEFATAVLAGVQNKTFAPVVPLLADLQAASATAHPLVLALYKDAMGEVKMALSDQALLQKWGRHFLPSLVRANVLQQCNNFKDASVQTYGGPLFTTLRDAGEKMFVKLPPPKPKVDRRRGSYTGASAARAARPVQMNTYYNRGGGCVAGDCTVAILGGATKAASAVRAGDVLASGAVVQRVVKIAIPGGCTNMVRFDGGLAITEYHPVRNPIDGQAWAFPVDLAAKGQATLCANEAHDFVYTYVVDAHHVASICGMDVVTLGHGFTDNEVVAHEYLGTNAVVRDLAALPSTADGVVVVHHGFARDAKTNRVTGLAPVSTVVALP